MPELTSCCDVTLHVASVTDLVTMQCCVVGLLLYFGDLLLELLFSDEKGSLDIVQGRTCGTHE